MITPTIKKKLKEYLKNDYTDDVSKILEKQGVTNRNGEQYSTSAIKNCLNGTLENTDIETALTIVYNDRRKKALKHQRNLQKAIEG